MTVNWPDNLPLGIRYGASTEMGRNNKISTEMDYGNKRRRRRFTNVPDYQQIEFKLNDTQLDQFQAFFKGVLHDGVVSFNAKVITGSNIETRRCTIDDDSVTVTHTDYNFHIVTFTLEIYERVGLDAGAEWLIGWFGEDFVLEFYDYLQHVVNVQYPTTMEDY